MRRMNEGRVPAPISLLLAVLLLLVGGLVGWVTIVTNLQGRTLADTAPSSNQVIKWNATTSRWEPGAAVSGGTITFKDEGTSLGAADTLDMVGNGITGTFAGSTGTITVPGTLFAINTGSVTYRPALRINQGTGATVTSQVNGTTLDVTVTASGATSITAQNDGVQVATGVDTLNLAQGLNGWLSGTTLKVTGTYGTGANTFCQGNDSRLSDARTPTAHAASHKSAGSDPVRIDELKVGTDVTTLNASLTEHGLMQKLDGSTTNFQRGDGAWAVPAGGSSFSGDMDTATQKFLNNLGTAFGGEVHVEDTMAVTSTFSLANAADTVRVTHSIVSASPSEERLTGDFDVTGNATVTGNVTTTRLFTAVGTAALPSYTFQGQAGDGFWSPATATIAGSVAGVESFRLGATTADRVLITAGTLASAKSALLINATQSATAVSQNAVVFNITPAGSATNCQPTAVRDTLNAGYTGATGTYATISENFCAGTGTNERSDTGNFGILAITQVATAGANVGVSGEARSSTLRNSGVFGRSTVNSAGANIGGAFYSTNAGSGTATALFATLGASVVSPTAAALVADNGTTSNPVVRARVNGVDKFNVDANGIPVLASIAAPAAGLTDGSLINDSTRKALVGFTNNATQTYVGVLFTQTANTTATNPTAETSLLGTGVGTKTLPASFFVAGKTVPVDAAGVISTAAAPGNVIFKFKYGSTVLAASASAVLPTLVTGAQWWFKGMATCQTAGASGKIGVQGVLAIRTALTTFSIYPLVEAGVAALDTTAAGAIDLTQTDDTSDAANITVSTNATIEAKN